MDKKETLKLINDYYESASDLAIKLIESEARQILKNNSKLDEFVMCMGSFFFTDEKPIDSSPNKIIDERDLDEPEFYNLIWELNEQFHVTGCPMRFTAIGKVITNW
jgi:hypothetical protein